MKRKKPNQIKKELAGTVNTPKELNKELAKTIDRLNKSLKRLEEKGYADKSKFYGDMVAAMKREVPYLHIDKNGKIRYGSGHLKSTDIEGRAALLAKLKSYETNYATRTISGIKKQAEKKRATIEKNMPELKGRLSLEDIDTIDDIYKMLREQGYLDHYGSGEPWARLSELKSKSKQEIENALNRLTEAENAVRRGRIANSKALKILMG